MKIDKVSEFSSHRLKYLKLYDTIIKKSLSRGLNKNNLDGYYEKHHILPKCMGGLDEESNLVLLTAREHLLIHLILHEMYPKIAGLCYTIFMFSPEKDCSSTKHREIGKKNIISTRYLAKLREECLGIPKSEETRYRMRLAQKDHIITDNQRKKISNSHKGKIKILIDSKETGKNISKGKKNKPLGTKIMDPDGIIHKTLKDCSIKYGYCPSTIKYWAVKKPEKGFKLIEEDFIPKKNWNHGSDILINTPDGRMSLKDAVKKYNRTSGTIRKWCKNFIDGFSFFN